MSIRLTINAREKMANEELQQLTEDLCYTLTSEANLPAEIKTGQTIKGAKGEPITIGVIVLAFITSGAAVALFNTIKAYFVMATKKMEFTFEKPDGTKVTFISDNFSGKEEVATLDKLKEFFNVK